MKKFKFWLISILVISLLVACGSDDEPQSETTEDGKTIINVAYKDDGPSNANAVKYYETLAENLKEDKDLDVQFELLEVAQGDYSEKLSLLLNSGEIPDLIYFQGGDQQIANQDLLEDLRPFVEESEYLKDILQPHNELRLENYPYLLWVKPIDYKVPVVRQDILLSLIHI